MKPICSLLLLHLGLSLWAQPVTESEPGYDLMLSFYVWQVQGILTEDSVIPPLPTLLVQDQHGTRTVRIARGTQTKPIRYTHSTPPTLYARPLSTETDLTPATAHPKQVASLKIPPHWKRALVLLFPEVKDGQGHWKTIPVWNPNLEIEQNALRILNSTPEDVVIEVEGKLSRLESTQVQVFTGKDLPSKRFRLRVHGNDPRGGTRLLFTAKRFRDELNGSLMILYPESKDRVGVLTLRDVPLPPPPEAQAENASTE